jgi:hypothetical protein
MFVCSGIEKPHGESIIVKVDNSPDHPVGQPGLRTNMVNSSPEWKRRPPELDRDGMIVLNGLFPANSCRVKDFDEIAFSDAIDWGGSQFDLQAVKFE